MSRSDEIVDLSQCPALTELVMPIENLQQLALIAIEAVIVASFLLALFHLRHRFGVVPLYVAVGTLQYLNVVLALTVYVEVLPGLVVSPGSAVLFTGTLFTVLLVYIREDAEEARLLVYGLAVANVALVLLSNLFGLHLESKLAANFLDLPPELLKQDLRLMVVGTVILLVDGLLVIMLYEVVARISKLPLFLRFYLCLAAVLALDGVLFVGGTFFGRADFRSILAANVFGKVFAALFFTLALAVFQVALRDRVRDEESASLPTQDLFRMLSYRQKFVQLRLAQRELSEISARLDLALSAANVGTWDWHPQRGALHWDDHMFRLFGVEKSAFGGSVEDFYRVVHPDDREQLRDELSKVEGELVDTTYRIVRSDGSIRVIHDQSQIYRNAEGQIDRMVGVCSDITEQRRAEEQLASLARLDPLTGVLNRRGLEATARRELARARRTGSPVVAVLVDCDDFKSINDRHGHTGGDAILTLVAHTLRTLVRHEDLLGRVGGDEFLLLLPETRLAEAEVAAERIRSTIAGSVPAGLDARVTVSLGVAQVSATSDSLSEIVAQTQSALRRSKTLGKDRVSLDFGAGPDTEEVRAIADEPFPEAAELWSMAQPIYRLADESIVAYEMLLRGPPGCWSLPEALLSHAAGRDRLAEFDLRTVAQHLGAIAGRRADGRVHINVIPATLLGPEGEGLARLVEDSGMANRMCIELAEQRIVGDPSRLRGATRRLRDLGVVLAVDGVGFNRTSLETFILLEPDFVKLSASTFAGLTDDPSVGRALGRLLRVVRSLDAEAIAVGVGSVEAARALDELGVIYGQGDLWKDAWLELTGAPTLPV